MASLVSRPRPSVQTYWARRNYRRLGRSPSRRLRVARLGGGSWNQQPADAGGSIIVRAPRKKKLAVATLRLRAAIALPARLLARLRDAYVDAMLALLAGRPCAALLARTRSCCRVPAEAGLLARRVPRARTVARGSSDFDRRMMAHIYSMVVTPELPCAGKA